MHSRAYFRSDCLRVNGCFWPFFAGQGHPVRWSNPMQTTGQVECKWVVKSMQLRSRSSALAYAAPAVWGMPFQRSRLCRSSALAYAAPAVWGIPFQRSRLCRSSALAYAAPAVWGIPFQRSRLCRSSALAYAAPAVWGMPFQRPRLCRSNTLSHAVPALPTTVLAPR